MRPFDAHRQGARLRAKAKLKHGLGAVSLFALTPADEKIGKLFGFSPPPKVFLT
jgi:hypothetical protein